MAAFRTSQRDDAIRADYSAFGGTGARKLTPWLDALCDLAPAELREIGRLYLANGRSDPAHSTAQRRVGQSIAEGRFEVDAWLIADQVETLCHLAHAQLGDESRLAREEMRAARVAAEWAAVAIALESELPSGDVETLTAPFAGVIASGRLRVV